MLYHSQRGVIRMVHLEVRESSDDGTSDSDEQPPGPPPSPIECAHNDAVTTN